MKIGNAKIKITLKNISGCQIFSIKISFLNDMIGIASDRIEQSFHFVHVK